MLVFNSSLRVRPLKETLKIGFEYAREYGISRVTDVTRLDNIGIPVFTSIRPGAQEGSLCVSAGKGFIPDEAKVGALMEGIEFAMAESSREKIPIVEATYSDILDVTIHPESLLDLCPKLGSVIPFDERVDCIEAMDLNSRKNYLIPAELVYCPYPKNTSSYFGSSTNGLASGNSLEEATIHGIFEVIERDITSFQTVHLDVSYLEEDGLPSAAIQIYEKVKAAGHKITTWYTHNEFDIPQFMTIIADDSDINPFFANMGFGCHGSKSIALIRSLTEAIQGRMSYIHGGRDDLTRDFSKLNKMTDKERITWHKNLTNKIEEVSNGRSITYDQAIELDLNTYDSASYLNDLLSFVKDKGFNRVFSTPFTQSKEPIQVVKVVIPGMEFFNKTSSKIGPRLKAYGTKIANSHIRRA